MKLPLYSAVKRSCAGGVKVTVSIDYQFFALEFGWSLCLLQCCVKKNFWYDTHCVYEC